jgi:hypothetical protein
VKSVKATVAVKLDFQPCLQAAAQESSTAVNVHTKRITVHTQNASCGRVSDVKLIYMNACIIVRCSICRTKKDTGMHGKEDEERSTCTYPWSVGKDLYICAMRQKKMTILSQTR